MARLGNKYLLKKYSGCASGTLALKRMLKMPLNEILFILPVILILRIGGGIHFIQRMINYTQRFGMLLAIWLIFYTALCIWGYHASHRQLEKKYGKLREEIQLFLEALLDESKDGY